MAERVAYASQCEHGRMHVNPEYGVLEIVDEHGQPTDDEGTIVGTSLHNSVAPLIRYRMNDTARWSHEPCPCGRTYPVIENIGGRLADQLYDLDGRAVNGTVIGFAFDGMRHIREGAGGAARPRIAGSSASCPAADTRRRWPTRARQTRRRSFLARGRAHRTRRAHPGCCRTASTNGSCANTAATLRRPLNSRRTGGTLLRRGGGRRMLSDVAMRRTRARTGSHA